MRRIFTLTGYFTRSFFRSLTGLIYIILALLFWRVFFDPFQGTPAMANYILLIGAFGAAVSFLITISIAGRANRAEHFPLVARLPSRVEYLTAVLISSLVSAALLQLLVAVLAMFRGPGLLWGRLIEIPPIWLATNILAIVLAMHASDFVTNGWSRVYLYGFLGLLLLGHTADNSINNWLIARLSGLAQTVHQFGWFGLSETFSRLIQWLGARETGILSQLYGWLIWPFNAVSDATINGFFNASQALAPSIILLYATVLFLLAADIFAGKDLEFVE